MISYPLSVSPDGGLLYTTDSTREQIMALLDCRFWERPMLTDFGVVDLTFDNLTPDTIGLYLAQIKVAIDYWITTNSTIELLGDVGDLERGILALSITVPNEPEPFLFTYSL